LNKIGLPSAMVLNIKKGGGGSVVCGVLHFDNRELALRPSVCSFAKTALPCDRNYKKCMTHLFNLTAPPLGVVVRYDLWFLRIIIN
jgi:hypothetical protein